MMICKVEMYNPALCCFNMRPLEEMVRKCEEQRWRVEKSEYYFHLYLDLQNVLFPEVSH